MAAATLSDTFTRQPAVVMGALGLVSGVLSALYGFAEGIETLQPVAKLFVLEAQHLPIGLFFGAAVALGLWGWSRKPWTVPIILVTTMYAWSAAIHTGIRLQRNTGDDVNLIAASFGAGLVGAGVTHLGGALVCEPLRQWRGIALTCIVGAVVGLMFYLGERRIVDERMLYVIWQPAVAFCIGLALGRRASPV